MQSRTLAVTGPGWNPAQETSLTKTPRYPARIQGRRDDEERLLRRDLPWDLSARIEKKKILMAQLSNAALPDGGEGKASERIVGETQRNALMLSTECVKR
ncbi:hypothetical protein KM043_016400 [Ampulex compressa]|nr:hypothetical protein KM043_016400 [Ampulex compressa]